MLSKPNIETLTESAKSNWKNIPGDVLQRFIDTFQLKDSIPLEEIKQHINYQIMIKKVSEALKVISVFDVRSQLNMKEIIERMINQDKVNEALSLVHEDDAELQKLLVQKNYDDKSIEIIEKFNINYKEFPQLVDKMEKKKVEKILAECNNNWEKAEERINSQKQLLFYLTDILVQKKKFKEAASIINRHSLNIIFSQQINSLGQHFELNELLSNQTQNTVLNRILERDGFGTTENLCFLEEEKYLTLSEYGIAESDVYFIDEINEEYNHAVDVLTQSKLIGFDSEFIPRWNKFEKGGVATLQLATNKEIFIFDTIKLINKDQFLEFITYLFQSEDIFKIGHSVWQDINEMDKSFKSKTQIQVKSFLDVGLIHKKIFNLQNIVSLKSVSNNILKKKVSKYEQISDWSKRPLRKCQIHYAALDALLPLILYQQLNEMIKQGDQDILKQHSHQGEKKQQNTMTNKEELIKEGDCFKYTKKTESFFSEKQPKFIVDNMLFKLLKFLRNSGLDSSFLQEKNYKLLCELSNKEERIILTRNVKFFQQITHQAPVFLILEQSNTEKQFKEILNFFKIKVSENMILSRCIKCNSDHFEDISSQQAHLFIDFYNPNYADFSFFQCSFCKQVYWEGEKFKRSKERFNIIAQDVNQELNDSALTQESVPQ